MAVSFKVPKSPAKSIFTIDEFLGVDLTNSPANIADNRSPNAPNMTRLVPGKVRKRKGYNKYRLYGSQNNVNFVEGTSYDELAITITEDQVNTWIKIYDMRWAMSSTSVFSLCCETDYKCEAAFEIVEDGWTAIEDISEGWHHYSGTKSYTANASLNTVSIKSAVPQTIYIKQLAVMFSKDSSYKWSLAPRMFYPGQLDSEVFGFHKAISNTSDSQSIINVNRALGTADPVYMNITEPGVLHQMNIYYLAENIADGRNIRIKFDYNYTITTSTSTSPSISLGGQNIVLFKDIGVAVGHYEGTYTSDPIEISHIAGYTQQLVTFLTRNEMEITFSNFSILYDMTDDYEWSAAPEDSEYYYIEDLYTFGSKNYSVTSQKSTNLPAEEATTLTLEVPVQTSNMLKGYSKLSFDLYYNYNNGTNITETKVSVVYYDNYSHASKTLDLVTFAPVKNNEGSISYMLSPANTDQSPKGANWSDNNYITKIIVTGVVSGANNLFVRLTNIKLLSATQKSDLRETDYTNLYHIGTNLYAYRKSTKENTKVYTKMNMKRSMSWQFGTKLFIIDGKNCYLYNYANNTLDKIGQTNAYIPLITFSKSPSGGGTSLYALNLLQPGFYEQFVCLAEHEGDATAKDFQLSFDHLDKTTVQAWVLNSNAEWVEKIEGTDFTVNRTTGVITFTTAPGVTPIDGEDNVKILAYKTFEGYSDRVRRCTFGTLFGVNGASDRVFLSGNSDYPNYDWYSGQNDPTYFPDTGYSQLGLEISAIVGYSLVNNYLAAHKDSNEPSQSVFIREGDLITREITTSTGAKSEVSDPAFKLINTLQGSPALSPYSFGYVETEPLFLTEKGIFALTTQDITGDKYGQNRSFYLNGQLLEEPNLKNAYCCVYDNMYYLAVNNKVYLLDGLQATRTDRSDPYSTRQYVGYVWNNIPATILFEDEGHLFFGTVDGKICQFYDDVDALDSYNDDGYPIDAWWETPDLDGKLFYKNKTFRYYAARLMAAIATSVKMWAMKAGAWTLVKTDNATGRYFDFGNINFEKFSFSTDQTEKVVHTKIKVKKVDKARFKLENDALNEPFGLFNIALEYVENGNYKG